MNNPKLQLYWVNVPNSDDVEMGVFDMYCLVSGVRLYKPTREQLAQVGAMLLQLENIKRGYDV